MQCFRFVYSQLRWSGIELEKRFDDCDRTLRYYPLYNWKICLFYLCNLYNCTPYIFPFLLVLRPITYTAMYGMHFSYIHEISSKIFIDNNHAILADVWLTLKSLNKYWKLIKKPNVNKCSNLFLAWSMKPMRYLSDISWEN